MSEYIVCPHCHNPLSQNEYVKVVRCKDCKLWKDECEWNRFYNDPDLDEPDGFCAWGERR